MGQVISNLLYKAIGVALSPVPIIVVILMLLTKRARRNSLAFLLGWVLSLAAIGSVVLLLANAGHLSGGGTPARVAYMIKLLIGVGFLYMPHRTWQRRPTHGKVQELPPWTEKIDTVSPRKAFTADLQALQVRMNAQAEDHWRAVTEGDVPAIVRFHAGPGFRAKWEFQFGFMGRGYQTFGLFLLGLWAGRRRVLEDVETHRQLFVRLWRWTGTLILLIPLLAASCSRLARPRAAASRSRRPAPGPTSRAGRCWPAWASSTPGTTP